TATAPTTTAAPAPAPPARPPATGANARVRRRWRRKASGGTLLDATGRDKAPMLERQLARLDRAGLHVVGHHVAIGRGDRGEGAAVGGGGGGPRGRPEKLGGAVALLWLAAIAGGGENQTRHEPGPWDLCER